MNAHAGTIVDMPSNADGPMYLSINRAVLDQVPSGTRRLLDLGCGAGGFGAAVKQIGAIEVVGVTHSKAEAQQASQHIDRTIVADLNHFEPGTLGRFDCVVCSHVLEHLCAPQLLLRRLHACLESDATVLIALPNVLYWRQRLEFMRGRFVYTEGGLMDHTHLRFFDWAGSAKLVHDGGFAVIKRMAEGGLPLSRWLGAHTGSRLDAWASRRVPGLFGVQFILRCRLARTPHPGATAA